MGDVRVKRVYDAAQKGDGARVLVDRVWPRGVSKHELDLALWAKDAAPSTKLRRWFGHDPARWSEFKKRYIAELREPAAKEALRQILNTAGTRTITLLYGAKDTEHNQALVLQSALRRMRK